MILSCWRFICVSHQHWTSGNGAGFCAHIFQMFTKEWTSTYVKGRNPHEQPSTLDRTTVEYGRKTLQICSCCRKHKRGSQAEIVSDSACGNRDRRDTVSLTQQLDGALVFEGEKKKKNKVTGWLKGKFNLWRSRLSLILTLSESVGGVFGVGTTAIWDAPKARVLWLQSPQTSDHFQMKLVHQTRCQMMVCTLPRNWVILQHKAKYPSCQFGCFKFVLDQPVKGGTARFGFNSDGKQQRADAIDLNHIPSSWCELQYHSKGGVSNISTSACKNLSFSIGPSASQWVQNTEKLTQFLPWGQKIVELLQKGKSRLSMVDSKRLLFRDGGKWKNPSFYAAASHIYLQIDLSSRGVHV